MAEAIDNIDSSKAVKMYTFRFDSSDKIVHLTQQQLDTIPYLATLVLHKDDFLSIQNENGEYVLNSPIEYNWLMDILRTITIENPYRLFNEISENNNILDILQLRDYLGIISFPLPLLKEEEDLILSKSPDAENTKHRVEYHKANLSEARQTAAEFIVALTKNEYNLHNYNTMERIFALIKEILSNASIFSSRFRHHTLAIVKECCYPFFSKNRQNLLDTAFQNTQYYKIDLLLYLNDDDQSYPDDFKTIFAWRGAYVPMEEKQTNSLITDTKEESSYNLFDEGDLTSNEFYGINHLIIWLDAYIGDRTEFVELRNSFLTDSYPIMDRVLMDSLANENEQNRKKDEAQSARSGRFNTLPERPKVDKFKHRCGPKAQKYR